MKTCIVSEVLNKRLPCQSCSYYRPDETGLQSAFIALVFVVVAALAVDVDLGFARHHV